MGLIPARAGKTANPQWELGENAAHPRACGENLVVRNSMTDSLGSSPRVRGKL